MRRLPTGVVVGPVYGGLLWLVNIGVVWPTWLNSVQSGPAIPVPYVAPMPLAGHLVYGFGLGVGYALLSRTAA